MSVPDGYKVIETQDRIDTVPPALKTRFHRRAVRRARMLNADRMLPSYRYEVVPEGGFYIVAPFQNQLEKQ